MSLYSTWCTNLTEKWRHPLSKGKPLASYHFIQQHQVSVFHSTLYCSALWICCCNYAEEIYKDLAFIIWLFNVSFLFPHFSCCVLEPSIARCCGAKFLKTQPSSYTSYWLTYQTFPHLCSPTRQVQCCRHSCKVQTCHFLLCSNWFNIKTANGRYCIKTNQK